MSFLQGRNVFVFSERIVIPFSLFLLAEMRLPSSLGTSETFNEKINC